MRKTLLVFGLLVVVTLAYSQSRPPSTPIKSEGRYQLVTSTVQYQTKSDGEADEQHLFLLDTETGRVWFYNREYTPKDKEGKAGPSFPRYFDTVPVDQLNGWDYSAAMRKWGELLKAWHAAKEEK